MASLVAVLWAVYFLECLAVVGRGEWMFRGPAAGRCRAKGEADLLAMGGKKGLAWLPLVPWHDAFRCQGSGLDAEQAAASLHAVRQSVELLRPAAGVLFLLLLPGLSLVVWSGRLRSLIVPWAGTALLAWAVCAWSFFRAYRLVHGRRPPLEVVAAHVLSPVSSSRGALAVCWSAPLPFHPMAVAAAACDDEEFLRLARIFLFDEPALRCEIERLAAARGLGERLRGQPRAEHSSLSRYCPRCHATYTGQAQRCADCPGVALADLAAE